MRNFPPAARAGEDEKDIGISPPVNDERHSRFNAETLGPLSVIGQVKCRARRMCATRHSSCSAFSALSAVNEVAMVGSSMSVHSSVPFSTASATVK